MMSQVELQYGGLSMSRVQGEIYQCLISLSSTSN